MKIERLYHGLGRLIAVLLIGFVVLIVGGTALIFWTSSGANNDFAACEMRSIETKVDGQQKPEYLSACMGSKGYRERGFCRVSNFKGGGCYYPQYFFWIK